MISVQRRAIDGEEYNVAVVTIPKEGYTILNWVDDMEKIIEQMSASVPWSGLRVTRSQWESTYYTMSEAISRRRRANADGH